MNKKLFTAVSAALVLFLLGSCNFGFSGKETTPFDGIPDGELVTPYAGTEVLRSVRSASETDNDLVDWKVARFFAVVEKIGFESFYMWQGAKVSEKPVIIYYPESNKPRYYEFRVIKDGKEVGSITCNASKKEGDPVAYVSEMTHKVNASVARELVSMRGNLSLTAVNYPNSFVMRERDATLENANFTNALTQTAMPAETVFVEKHADVFLKEASAETLAKMEITEEEKMEALAEISENKAILADFWEDIDESKEKILAVTDEEIENEFAIPNAISGDSIITPKRLEYVESEEIYRRMLYPWYDKRKWIITNVDVWCGPAAVTFVALGLGKEANCPYVPLKHNDKEIRYLYYQFEARMGQGPKLIKHLNKGMRALTDYRVEKKYFHRWNDVDSHLKEYKLPVISLRSGWYKDGGFHYRTIIGTAIDLRTEHHIRWWHWFGWKYKKWKKRKYTHWYYMHDNGVDSDSPSNYNVDGNKKHGNFWEKSGLWCQSTLGLVKKK